jgi:hypothetical protein
MTHTQTNHAIRPISTSELFTIDRPEIILVTPELAKEILADYNPHNRPLNAAHVSHLVSEMDAGRWMFNGDPLRFSYDRRLLDGQHKLTACVKANMPITLLYVPNLDPKAFHTIDAGKKRSAGDTLAVLGKPNAARLASALRFVHRYKTQSMTKRAYVTNSDIKLMAAAYPHVEASVTWCLEHSTKLVPFSVLAGCHCLFAEKDGEAANKIVEDVVTGTDLKEGDAVLVFRERMVDNAASKAKLSETYIAALFIKAWNARRDGKEVRHLRYKEGGNSPEAFPEAK